MSSARLFLGVDGGQSSTTAVIGDERGSILGIGKAGPCNHVGAAEGPAKLRATVSECLGQACEAAGLDPETVSFHSACFGMSGGPDDKAAILSEIIRTSNLMVTDDAVVALSGALGGRQGVVTIAGTGSISLGRDEHGRRARAGGWGYVFGDEGGAFDLVRQALRAIIRNEEGWGASTKLRDVLLHQTSQSSANALMHAFYTKEWPRSRIASLAPFVNAAAINGDLVANEILEKAAQKLAGFALAARNQLWSKDEPVEYSFIGGVFQSGLLLNAFRLNIESQFGDRLLLPLLDAAHGAVLEAYRNAGVSPDLNKLLTSDF